MRRGLVLLLARAHPPESGDLRARAQGALGGAKTGGAIGAGALGAAAGAAALGAGAAPVPGGQVTERATHRPVRMRSHPPLVVPRTVVPRRTVVTTR